MLRTSTGSVSKLSRPISSAVANCSSKARRPRSSSSPPPLSSFLPLPSQIHVVPFSISPETALKRSDGYVPLAFYKGSPKRAWWAHRLLPSFFPNRFSVVNQKMVYLPVWSVKAKATTTVTVTGEEILSARGLFEGSAIGGKAEKEERRRRQEEEEERFKIRRKRTFKLGFETELAFFPGTSSYPLSSLSLQPTLRELPEALPIFSSARHLNQFGEKVTFLPFDSSPLVLPDLISNAKRILLSYRPSGYEGKVGDEFIIEDTEKDLAWDRLDVTPLYLPFHLIAFKFDQKEQTILVEATNDKARHCELYIPHSSGDDATYPESPYGTTLDTYSPPYSRGRSHDFLGKGFYQPSHFNFDPLHKKRGVQWQTKWLYRAAALEEEKKDEERVERDPREDLSRRKELEQGARLSVDEDLQYFRDETWYRLVEMKGNEWMGLDGKKSREEIRRLSLKGGEKGKERVGRIVRWVGAEQKE
ncbi:hypothetical protein BDY24DRAFT_417610 [Mrakia frigida]|uniref:uncharacterized protein n=1 Tax=Mrakia frigida TaxID=29902 RepID=UPI003FCC1CAE